MTISEAIYHDFINGELTGFYSEVYPSMLMFASRRLGPDFAFLAEDCVQDAIFTTFKMKEKVTSAPSLAALLTTTLHNRIISVVRHEDSKQKYSEFVNETNDEISEDLQTSIIEQEALTNLFKAIDSLPRELREIFETNFEQGLTYKEVAEKLEISESTVKRRRQQLIDTLRKDLSRYMILFFAI